MPTVNLGRIGFVNKGTWSNVTEYKVNDIVRYNGNTYACRVAHTGQTPPTSGDNTYWQYWVGTSDMSIADLSFDNTGTGLDSTNGQTAIVEVNSKVDALNAGTLSFDSSGTDLESTNTRAAIIEVDERILYSTDVASVSWDSVSDQYDAGNAKAIDVHKNMRRCVFNRSTKEVAYYLDPNDSTLQADGVTPAILTGLDGDVMVEIPRVWYRIEHLNNRMTMAVSSKPRTGFVLHPMFEDNVEYVYASAYDAAVFDFSTSSYIDGLNLDDNRSRVNTTEDLLVSVSGRFPMVGLTRAEFRQLAANTGYEQHTFWLWQLIMLLYITEYGNWNSQAQIGEGNVNRTYDSPSSSNQADSPHVAAGASNFLGNNTGSLTTPNPFISYRGLENIWGNCWTFIDGFNVNDRQVFVSNDPLTYADDTDVGYTSLGVPMPATSGGYVRSFQQLVDALVPLSVTGASSSTFLTDALWTETGWRVGYVGGFANSGVAAGVGALSAANASAARNRLLGARCCYRKKFA